MKKIKPKLDLRYYGVYTILLFIPYVIIILVFDIVSTVSAILFIFFILIITLMFGLKILFNYIEFLIDEHKISYINSFVNYVRIDIRYEDIKEVTLKRGLLQRICGLGSISLLSNATTNKSGIKFFSIENPTAVYEQIQEKINQHKR